MQGDRGVDEPVGVIGGTKSSVDGSTSISTISTTSTTPTPTTTSISVSISKL